MRTIPIPGAGEAGTVLRRVDNSASPRSFEKVRRGVAPLAFGVGLAVAGAAAEVKPCPPQSTQDAHRGSDPRAGGIQAAQSYARGTDPRGAAPAGDGRAAVASNYDRGQDPRNSGFGRTDTSYDWAQPDVATQSAAADRAGCR